MDLLAFEVDRTSYALAVADVQEILRAVSIVPLPKAPAVVPGIINLRGRPVPLIDLRARFGAPRRPIQPDEHFVVVRAGPRTVAVRADRAVGLLQVDDAHIEPAAAAAPASSFVAGLATLPDGIVLIADTLSFLTEAESARLDEALAARMDITRATPE